jgi:hypothetical protein
MPVLSKLWGKWLLAGQYANVALMLLMAFGSLATDIAWLQTWKQHALEIHASITAVLGTLQAMAKALPDANQNGVPDVFEAPGVPPTPPTEGV